MAGTTFTVDIADVTRGLVLSRTTVLRRIDGALRRGAQTVARDWRRDAPKAFSTYTNSIRVTQLERYRYEIVAGVNYAPYQEDGTRGGRMPPVRSIYDWLRVRRIEPRDPNMTLRDLAFVVARSIGRRGVPARPSAGPALERNRAVIERLVSSARDAGIREAWGH